MDDYSEKLIGAAFKTNFDLEMRIKEAASMSLQWPTQFSRKTY
jgi:hypothetical protein